MHFRPRLLCVVVFICVWKRRCADVRVGTQAPPLRFRLGRLRVAVDTVWGELRVNGYFVCVDCVQMVILFVWDCVEKYYGAW